MFQVAVPLSPTSSEERQTVEGAVSQRQTYKTSQIYLKRLNTSNSVNITLSSIELNHKRKIKSTRRSKSEEVGAKKVKMQEQIVQILEEIFESNKGVMKNDVILRLNAKLKMFTKNHEKGNYTSGKNSKQNTTVYKYCGDKSPNYKRHVFDNIKYFTSRYSTKVYRAEVGPLKFHANTHKAIIKDWLDNIGLKPYDYLGKQIEREYVYKFIMNRLKDLSLSGRLDIDRRGLKSEILDLIQEVPLEIPPGINKRLYLHRLAYSLIEKLQCGTYQKSVTQRRQWIINVADESKPNFTTYVQPTEAELKLFLKDVLGCFYSTSCIEVSGRRIKDTATELADILLDSREAINNGRLEQVVEDMVPVLGVFGRLPEHEAKNLASHIINRLRDYICNTEESYFGGNNRYEMLYEDTEQESMNEALMFNDSTDENDENKIEFYINQLSEEIDEWLYSLQKELPQARNYNFRQLVAHDLAADIVNRQKYLKLNCLSESEEDELENLRYQIFKWIHKLGGDNNMTALHYAPELMRKIKRVPVPMLSDLSRSLQYYNDNIPNFRIDVPSTRKKPYTTFPEKISTETMTISYDLDLNQMVDPKASTFAAPLRGTFSDQGQFYLGTVDVRPVQTPVAGPSGSGSPGQNNLHPQAGPNHQPTSSNFLTPGPVSVEEMNDEYDKFLKEWVKEIPIPASNPEEVALAEKMRQGIYNGIWKAVAKIKSQPLTLSNPFYYEDVLDDEIEELFSMLPQTQELINNKHLIKVKLIEKTSNLNEQIKIFHAPEVFKQQLVDNISVYIPRLTTPEEGDPVKVYEELQILLLADNYILFTNYKESDPVKANVYKTKLLRKTQEFIEELKKKHSKEMKDIDVELYVNDFVSAMEQVPLPSEDTIHEEADKILLGLEIEQWYSDLPIAKNDDITEQLKRKRLRDALAKKIHDMEKSMDLNDSDAKRALRNEVSIFLNRIPLGKDESLNINFMVTELTNRMKNRPKDLKDKRKSMVLQESVNYDEFSRNMPGSSSMHAGNQHGYTTIHDLVDAAELPFCCKIRPEDPAIPLCCVPQNVSVGPDHELRLTREKRFTMDKAQRPIISNIPSTSPERRFRSPPRPPYQQIGKEKYYERGQMETGRPPGTYRNQSYQREATIQPYAPQVFKSRQDRDATAIGYRDAIPNQPQWQTENFGPAPSFSPSPPQATRHTSIHEFQGYSTFEQQPPAASSPIQRQTGYPSELTSPVQAVKPSTKDTISAQEQSMHSPTIQEFRGYSTFEQQPLAASSPIQRRTGYPSELMSPVQAVRPVARDEGRQSIQSPSIRQQSPEPEWYTMEETRAPTIFRNLLPPPDANASLPIRTLPQDSGSQSIRSYTERTYTDTSMGQNIPMLYQSPHQTSGTGPRIDGAFGAGPQPGQVVGPSSQMVDSFGAVQPHLRPGMSPAQYPTTEPGMSDSFGVGPPQLGQGLGSSQAARPFPGTSPMQFESGRPQGPGISEDTHKDTGIGSPFSGDPYRPTQSLAPGHSPQREAQYRPSQSLSPRRDTEIDGSPGTEQRWSIRGVGHGITTGPYPGQSIPDQGPYQRIPGQISRVVQGGEVDSQRDRPPGPSIPAQGPYQGVASQRTAQPHPVPIMAPYEELGTRPGPPQVKGGQRPPVPTQGPYQSFPDQIRATDIRMVTPGMKQGTPSERQGPGTDTLQDSYGTGQSMGPNEAVGTRPSPTSSQVTAGQKPRVSIQAPYYSIPGQETSRPCEAGVEAGPCDHDTGTCKEPDTVGPYAQERRPEAGSKSPFQNSGPIQGTGTSGAQGMGAYGTNISRKGEPNQGITGPGISSQDSVPLDTAPNISGVAGPRIFDQSNGPRATSVSPFSGRNEGVTGPSVPTPYSGQNTPSAVETTSPCQRGRQSVGGPCRGLLPRACSQGVIYSPCEALEPKSVCRQVSRPGVCGQGTGSSSTCQGQGIGKPCSGDTPAICQGLSRWMGNLGAQRSGTGKCVATCVGPKARPTCAETYQQAPEFFKSTDREGIMAFRDQLRYSHRKVNCACNQTPAQFFPTTPCQECCKSRETQTQNNLRSCYESSEAETKKCQCVDKLRCKKSRPVCYSKQDFQMGCPQTQYYSQYHRYC